MSKYEELNYINYFFQGNLVIQEHTISPKNKFESMFPVLLLEILLTYSIV